MVFDNIRKKGVNMDKYTKFILTVIAVAMIGILFKGEINKPAHAADPVGWQSVCVGGYTFVMTNSGGVAQSWEKHFDLSRPTRC